MWPALRSAATAFCAWFYLLSYPPLKRTLFSPLFRTRTLGPSAPRAASSGWCRQNRAPGPRSHGGPGSGPGPPPWPPAWLEVGGSDLRVPCS